MASSESVPLPKASAAPRTYVITGVSSGIGLELVRQLAAKGHKVFGTCRKRASSVTGKDLISAIKGDVTIIEGVDVTNDKVADVLAASSLAGVTIDVIIHNAGSYNGVPGLTGGMQAQSLENISVDRMRQCFELNTLGPLRVQKALNAQMRSPGGKIAVISTGLSSIADNSSGGRYGYRVSKAAVNMLTKCFSADLKSKGIAAMAIAPGFVATNFGPGLEAMTKWGAKPVEDSAAGILTVIDSILSMETTGSFYNAMPSDGSAPKAYPW